MTTTLDIMAFLKADKEARIREHQENKEIRAQERAEDMKNIVLVIKSGVKEEVNSVIKPIQDKIEEQERTVENLTMQLSNIMMEVTRLKSLSQQSVSQAVATLPVVVAEGVVQEDQMQKDIQQETRVICAAAIYTRNIMKTDHRVFPYIPKEMCTGATGQQRLSSTMPDMKRKSRLK